MKNIFATSLTLSALAFIVLIVPLTTVYAADQIKIEGTVLNDKSKPVGDAVVNITCYGTGANSGQSVTASTTTDKGSNKGYYLVNIPKGICKNGSAVSVSASKDSEGGSNDGIVAQADALIDITMENQVNVPEFSPLLGVVMFIASAGAFLLLRKKNAVN